MEERQRLRQAVQSLCRYLDDALAELDVHLCRLLRVNKVWVAEDYGALRRWCIMPVEQQKYGRFDGLAISGENVRTLHQHLVLVDLWDKLLIGRALLFQADVRHALPSRAYSEHDATRLWHTLDAAARARERKLRAEVMLRALGEPLAWHLLTVCLDPHIGDTAAAVLKYVIVVVVEFRTVVTFLR